MASEAQLAANRKNARNSTGPRTEKGKAASSQNARTHGFYTKHFVLLSTENADEFDALNSGYCREFQPATPAERHYVREIVESQWRLSRIGRMETNYLEKCGDEADVEVLLKWDRLTNSARRAHGHAVRDLLSLREKRGYYLALSPDPRFEDPGVGYDDPPPWPQEELPDPPLPRVREAAPPPAPATPQTAPPPASEVPEPEVCINEVCKNEPDPGPPAASAPPPEAALPGSAAKNCKNEPEPARPSTAPAASAPASEVPTPKICGNEPNSGPRATPAMTPERPPDPPVIRVPYALAEELKDLIRFHPRFDPSRSRKMSPRLAEYCRDPDRLKAVRKLIGTI